MKKVLAIALALVVALAAVSSFALVDRGTTANRVVYLEKVQISQGNVLMGSAIGGASLVADLGATYSADSLIYIDMILNFDNARTGATDGAFALNIKSSDVVFPAYYYATTTAPVIHYADVNEILQLLPVIAGTAFRAVTGNVATIDFPNTYGALLQAVHAAIPATSTARMKTNVNGAANALLHVGLMGIVKAPASGSTTGTVTVYETVAAGSFTQRAYVGAYAGVDDPTLAGAGYCYYVDTYVNGALAWRIYKLNGSTNTEYLIQKVVSNIGSTPIFSNVGVGFRNAGPNFSKVTYREGLSTLGYNPSSTVTLASVFASGIAADKSFESYTGSGVFNYGSPFGGSLASIYNEFVSFYGFNFAYTSAVIDTDFTGKAGHTTDMNATFNYFGASIDVDDIDIDIPPTGDASASVLIVLGASAILAAAALFFVMKKARD